MVKDIITVAFNSLEVEKTTNSSNNNTLFRIDTPPIIIRNKGILKVSNFCHMGTATGHTDNMYLFRIRGIMVDTSRFFTGNGGYPLILTTTFNNNRSLYDENVITLTRQTINAIEILVDTYTPSGTISNIIINNGGSGYLAGQRLKFTLSSTEIEINVNSVSSSGAITSFSYITPPPAPQVYTTVPSIPFINYINGTGAIITPYLVSGTIVSYLVGDGGSGYKVGQTIAIIGGGGSGAVGTVGSVDALGAIVSINATVVGSGYGTTPTASVNPTTQTPTATLTPIMNFGNVIKESIPNSLNFSITFIIEQDINE